jgi:hypothetical protein
VIDVTAILSLTEPARSHPDVMARREFEDDLYTLLRRFEVAHDLPMVTDRHPKMKMRSAMIALLRAYQELHGFEPLSSVRERPRRREAA